MALKNPEVMMVVVQNWIEDEAPLRSSTKTVGCPDRFPLLDLQNSNEGLL